MKTAAGAVLSLSAISANAGIIIPAGDWTLDVSGNVNAYTSWSKLTNGSTNRIRGGIVNGTDSDGNTSNFTSTNNSWGNGLLPNFLSIGGSTRQNDLDVAFTISLQPGTQNSSALQAVGSANNGGLNNRQAFITVGDKSWGSVKMGKDLGIFASDAILNDMTLLGVGGGSAGSAGNTSLGRIGAGYIYADWKPQLAYTTPNFSGFQATVGITQAFISKANGSDSAKDNAPANDSDNSTNNASVAYEGKASYSFAANDVTGKIWVSGIAQHVGYPYQYGNAEEHPQLDPMAYAADIGAKLSAGAFDVVGYYYSGSGVGTTGQMLYGYGLQHGSGWQARDSDGGYVQAMYTLPTKTKLGVSWGISNLDSISGENQEWSLVKHNESWIAMIQHPLTKHLNLVAEYSNQKSENQEGDRNTSNTGSLGAILFF